MSAILLWEVTFHVRLYKSGKSGTWKLTGWVCTQLDTAEFNKGSFTICRLPLFFFILSLFPYPNLFSVLCTTDYFYIVECVVLWNKRIFLGLNVVSAGDELGNIKLKQMDVHFLFWLIFSYTKYGTCINELCFMYVFKCCVFTCACRLKLECEKLATEKTEMQRHYVMVSWIIVVCEYYICILNSCILTKIGVLCFLQYYEMSYGLNVEMHKQVRAFSFFFVQGKYSF